MHGYSNRGPKPPAGSYTASPRRRRDSFSSTIDGYQTGSSGRQNLSPYGYPNYPLNGTALPTTGYGPGSSTKQDMRYRNQGSNNTAEQIHDWEDSMRARNSPNSRYRVTDEIRGGVEGVEQSARQMMVVLKLKNAITYVADAVELYDGVDATVGHLPIWAACAESHFADIEDAVNQLRKLRSDCRKLGTAGQPRFIAIMQQIVRDLDKLSPRWMEAYARECQKTRRKAKARLHQPSGCFETGWFLEDLKRFLQSWKSNVLPDVEGWLRGTKDRCNDVLNESSSRSESSW